MNHALWIVCIEDDKIGRIKEQNTEKHAKSGFFKGLSVYWSIESPWNPQHRMNKDPILISMFIQHAQKYYSPWSTIEIIPRFFYSWTADQGFFRGGASPPPKAHEMIEIIE